MISNYLLKNMERVCKHIVMAGEPEREEAYAKNCVRHT